MYKEDELHLFRSGRSMGHAAVNHFNRGYKRLDEGRIETYLKKSTAYADIMADARHNSEAIPDLADRPPNRPEEALQEAMQIDLTIHEPIQVPNQIPSSSSTNPSSQTTSDSGSIEEQLDDEDLEYDSDDDRSHEHLSSGSDFASFVDRETGSLCLGWDSDDGDDENEGVENDPLEDSETEGDDGEDSDVAGEEE